MADLPPAKYLNPLTARYAQQAIELSELLARVAVLVAPPDEPLELIDLTETVDLVRQLVLDRDRLHRAAEQAVEDLGHAIMPAPSVLVAMSSYLRAALKGPNVSERDEYDDMGREELLLRVKDWRKIANDRSAEIARLHDQRRIVDAALRDAVTERDKLTGEVTTLSIRDMAAEGEFHELEDQRHALIDIAAGAVMLLREVEKADAHPLQVAMLKEALVRYEKLRNPPSEEEET